MKWTSVLGQAASKVHRASSEKKRSIKSLALTTHFKLPAFGMKKYEILSRASAFLLGVDPPDPEEKDGPYGHLELSEHRAKMKEYWRHNDTSPMSSPDRELKDMGWLEYLPREIRPQVHIVASGHVLSPFLWRDYYPHDWLAHVRQEHCKYSLEAYDATNPQEPLCSVPVDTPPFHHPEGTDVSLLHFGAEEDKALNTLKNVGVEILYLRNPEKLYERGEEVIFDGYIVVDQNPVDHDEFDKVANAVPEEKEKSTDEDTRVFFPSTVKGKLSCHTNDRFFAPTTEILQEGFCGAPVLDKDGDLCGTVLGIVPRNYEKKDLAGNAVFMPSHVMAHFIEIIERIIVKELANDNLFSLIVSAKETNDFTSAPHVKHPDGSVEEITWDQAYEYNLATLRKNYSKEEVDAILQRANAHGDEVLDVFNKEGGNLAEIIDRVRQKSTQIQNDLRKELKAKQVLELENENSKL